MNTLRKSLAIALFGYLFINCSRSNSDPSKLHHKWGRTSIPPQKELEPCENSEDHPEETSYLKRLAQKISDHNPETFRGPYSISKFCFVVDPRPGENAYSNSLTRTVGFQKGLIHSAILDETDHLAILSHELAHITMQHHLRTPSAEDLPEDYRDQDNTQEASRHPALIQWEEQQADEVGAELFIHAGFSFKEFTSHLEKWLKAENQWDSCVKQLQNPQIVPTRLEGATVNRHPPLCFRIYNLKKMELLN